MLKLARDVAHSVLQVSSYKTSAYENIADGGTITMATDGVVRLMPVDGEAWVSRGTDEGAGKGLYLGLNELTMLVYEGETLYIHGATVNAVAVAK